MYTEIQPTQDQINAKRDKARDLYAHLGFEINSNSRHLHARCTTCGAANVVNPENWMVFVHTACRENAAQAKADRARKLYALSIPALNGETVTQGHVDYCKDNSHMAYRIGDEDQGICPRCGVPA